MCPQMALNKAAEARLQTLTGNPALQFVRQIGPEMNMSECLF